MIRFTGLVILSMSRLNFAFDNLQMPARPALCLHWPHTLTFCRSIQTVRPPHVYLDFGPRASAHLARCLGTFFPHSFVTQPFPSTSSDNPWKLIFSTIILIDCVSFYTYMCTLFSDVPSLHSLSWQFLFSQRVLNVCLLCLLTYLHYDSKQITHSILY